MSTVRDRARRAGRYAADHIGFISVALVALFCIVHAFDPPRLNWGDSGSDYNIMESGRNFQKYGFLTLRLTPFVLDPAVMTQYDRAMMYTHYPQLPDLMNGVLRVVFRLSDLVQFRFVALGFSFAALFFIYGLIVRYWSRQTGQIALALWVVNPLWIQHADYLHHGPYGAFFGFGALYFLVRFLREDRRGFLAAAGVFTFFMICASYDWWFFGPLLIGGAAIEHYRSLIYPRGVRVLLLLAGCVLAAVAAKFATNIWALGFHGWLNDLRFQYVERATDQITRTTYQNGVIAVLIGRVNRFFTPLLFPIAALWLLIGLRVIRPRFVRAVATTLRQPLVNPLWLLAASLPFFILFTELWVGQYYPGLMMIPFYAVSSAAVAALLLNAPQRGVRVIGGVLVLGLVANSVDEVVAFKPAFFPLAAIQSLRVQLDKESPYGKHVLVNHVFGEVYRYYFQRDIIALTTLPPGMAPTFLPSLANPVVNPRSGTPNGAIFVQHKHVVDELYDKGYYYFLARDARILSLEHRDPRVLWELWANPRPNRAILDSVMRSRDSVLGANAARVGKKLYDNDFYTMWRIPVSAGDTATVETPPVGIAAPRPHRN